MCCGMESCEVPSSSAPHPGMGGPQVEELCCLLTSGEEDAWDTEGPASCPVCLMWPCGLLEQHRDAACS